MTDDEQLLRDEKKLIEEDEGRLRRYLLGLSSPEESAEIERAILVDDLGSILNVIEDELLEDYITGELKNSDRSRFEERFLFNQESIEKIRVSAMLLGRPDMVERLRLEGLRQRTSSLLDERTLMEMVLGEGRGVTTEQPTLQGRARPRALITDFLEQMRRGLAVLTAWFGEKFK
jgi:hypothetical protein